ncbi:MAG: DMT family transporter [Acidobacteriaceae bacterium]|nr:DMT family transporter [Acidobacteriaceae bacterium]
MTTAWLYPVIIVAGMLQALGPPMNGQLRQSLINPWLATLVSFGLVFAVFIIVAAMFPRPLPSTQGFATMPWWAPLGGIIGAVAVITGLLFVDRVGAGPFAAMTVSANLIMSVIIDQFGLVNMPVHTLSFFRALGVALLIGGVVLITRW